MRLEDGTLLVVATQCQPQAVIAAHAYCWGIERLFGIFKSGSFSQEDTHLRDAQRLEFIFRSPECGSSLGIAERSLDYLRSLILNLDCKFEQFLEAVQFLSCTWTKA
ncbi:MAG: hypothetical protein BRC38_16880 [Cyanobacteria bacterium QH_6_48_35]|nr:MAG: hypothetical protein BRC38_16880 [Cyanobacteria bacterium QH_6_48_35]